MGTADRIERERQAKRARIIEAARELFVERGVEAVTLREVAQKIEYSTTAIYVHFADKQALLEALVREDFAVFDAALAARRSIADPVERLTALGDAYVEFALTMPHHYRLLFMTPQAKRAHGPNEPLPGLGGFGLLVATVAECIAAGRFRPELTDATGIAQALWASVHGLVSLLIVVGDIPHFEWRSRAELLDLGVGSMVRGMLADPTAAVAKHKPRPAAAKPRRR
jgi:AcrR family transcriptional regulator